MTLLNKLCERKEKRWRKKGKKILENIRWIFDDKYSEL